MTVLPVPYALPTPETARLPAVYEAAVTALSTCERIDECKVWADKAAAIASYARQAHDETLLRMAIRIQARAIRRCGELLKEIEIDYDRHTNKTDQSLGTLSLITRGKAAKQAGLSRWQKETAIRVANIPAKTFDDAIEGDDLLTITELAELGTKKQEAPYYAKEGITQEAFHRATTLGGHLQRLDEFCRGNPPAGSAAGFQQHEKERIKSFVINILDWLQTFAQIL